MKQLFSFLITILSIPVFATTWYVSPTGNDSNSGKSEVVPFLTIQKAIDPKSRLKRPL